MNIRVLVNGAHGKMGSEVVKALQNNPEFKLVGEGDHHTKLSELIQSTDPQVVVDFTNPNAVFENTKTILEAGKHPVIGTTGLSETQIETLKKQAQKIGGIIAPNFAIGVILMMQFAREAARYFPHAEIIELHHDTKLDAPSGTAIKTAQMMIENRTPCPAGKTEKENLPGSRGADYQGIPIHAVRLPGLIGHQMILFGGEGEVLTLKHDAMDRKCFMAGVLLACRKVMTLDKLVYGLEHLL